MGKFLLAEVVARQHQLVAGRYNQRGAGRPAHGRGHVVAAISAQLNKGFVQVHSLAPAQKPRDTPAPRGVSCSPVSTLLYSKAGLIISTKPLGWVMSRYTASSCVQVFAENGEEDIRPLAQLFGHPNAFQHKIVAGHAAALVVHFLLRRIEGEVQHIDLAAQLLGVLGVKQAVGGEVVMKPMSWARPTNSGIWRCSSGSPPVKSITIHAQALASRAGSAPHLPAECRAKASPRCRRTSTAHCTGR